MPPLDGQNAVLSKREHRPLGNSIQTPCVVKFLFMDAISSLMHHWTPLLLCG